MWGETKALLLATTVYAAGAITSSRGKQLFLLYLLWHSLLWFYFCLKILPVTLPVSVTVAHVPLFITVCAVRAFMCRWLLLDVQYMHLCAGDYCLMCSACIYVQVFISVCVVRVFMCRWQGALQYICSLWRCTLYVRYFTVDVICPSINDITRCVSEVFRSGSTVVSLLYHLIE